MSEIIVAPVSIEKTQKEFEDVAGMSENGRQVVIQNQSQYEAGAKLLDCVKKRYNDLEARRKEITAPMNVAKEAIMDLFRRPLGMLKEAENNIKEAMIGYTEEQKRKAMEAQRKLEEEARRQADIERKRKEEQERVWREKQRQLEEAGKFEQAQKAQEKADQRAEEAAMVEANPVPVVAAKISAVRGVSYSELWSAEVVDMSLVPREYLIPNQAALDGISRATKGAISIPGVKFVSKKVLSSRR